MKGYKATDRDMKCRGFQFELGKWYEHDGELSLCESGFHFCQYPSGPWSYYTDPSTRIFEVEAEEILESPMEPGSDLKQVCRRIKLVKEITPGSNYNTGNYNTGYCNTGDRNTGNYNTGNSNTGDCNTGNWNTGNRNTGNWNTGNSNTGYCNTGDRNTGNRNTGNWNITNYSSGFFCCEEPKVISFDIQTELTRDDFLIKYPESYDLGAELLVSKKIEFERYKNIPGITPEKLKTLHEKFLKAKMEA